MNRRKLTSLIVLASAASLAMPGCKSTVFGEGAGLVLGASGTFMPIQPLAADKDSRPLGAYRRFELGQVTDGIGGKTPPELISHLPEAFAKELAGAKLPDEPSGKALLIRGTVIHYESADTLGFVTGPLEEAIVLTEFVDRDTDAVLGRANCIGRTKARVNAGVQKKAEGLAKAFVKWIESRFPEDQKVK